MILGKTTHCLWCGKKLPTMRRRYKLEFCYGTCADYYRGNLLPPHTPIFFCRCGRVEPASKSGLKRRCRRCNVLWDSYLYGMCHRTLGKGFKELSPKMQQAVRLVALGKVLRRRSKEPILRTQKI